MNILDLFHTYTVDEITGVETNITSEMYQKIALWSDMMRGQAPWNKKARSCGILPQLAGRLNFFVTREIGIEVENEAIKQPMKQLNQNVDKIVEYITLLGGGLIRPIYSNGKLQYEAIPLGNYLPTKYDFDGTLTGALILKQILNGDKKYLLTEQHLFENSTHKVKCQLYRNDNGALKKAALTDCQQTAAITPEYEWRNVKQPMIIEFRNHAVNKIDGTNVPVALIAGAEDLIEAADEQFERMIWEQKAGEMRIWADSDLFKKRQKRGEVGGVQIEQSELKPDLNRLLVMVDGDGSTDGKKIVEHAPALRTSSQNEFLQQVFRRIELTINIGKGTVSDAESVQQTATQYSGGRQELFAIVDKIEDEIANKYQDCAAVFAHMASAYGLGTGSAEIQIKWNDDQTRKDIQQAKQTALQEISSGVLNKWEYRRDFYGEDEAAAKANVPEEPLAPDPFNYGA